VAGLFFILGVFPVLHTFFLRQADLEKSLAPIHLALVGALGAFLFAAWGFAGSRRPLLVIALSSALLSLGFRLLDAGGLVLGVGWPALIIGSVHSTLRGGT
jgi:hypothetical protein